MAPPLPVTRESTDPPTGSGAPTAPALELSAAPAPSVPFTPPIPAPTPAPTPAPAAPEPPMPPRVTSSPNSSPPRMSNDAAIAVPGGVTHPRSRRPRPAVCSVVTRSVPCGTSSRATRSRSSAFVEGDLSRHTMRGRTSCVRGRSMDPRVSQRRAPAPAPARARARPGLARPGRPTQDRRLSPSNRRPGCHRARMIRVWNTSAARTPPVRHPPHTRAG